VQKERPAPSVNVIAAEQVTRAPVLVATGTVEPIQQVSLTAQVVGQVRSQSKKLVPGGRFKSGQALLRIDARDYDAAVVQARSRLRQAELEFELETGRQITAQKEWQLLGRDPEAPDAALATRKPHLAVAEEHVKAAEAALKVAKLNHARTVIKAPFNSVVVREQVDPGTVLQPGVPIATLVGTDQLRVRVSLPVEGLRSLGIPGWNAKGGSSATILQVLSSGETLSWEGRILGLSGELDPATRTATILVGVDRPFDVDAGELPLLPGTFVEIELRGAKEAEVMRVPREAIVAGDQLWSVGEDQLLVKESVSVGWTDSHFAYVVSGLETGTWIAFEPAALPMAGSKVRPIVVDRVE